MKIFTILFCLSLIFNFSCRDEKSKSPALLSLLPAPSPSIEPITPDNPIIEDDPISQPKSDHGPVKIALQLNEGLKFYDGESVWTWKTGNIKKAASGIYSSENILYSLNDNGDISTSKNLVTVPDQISLNPVSPKLSISPSLSLRKSISYAMGTPINIGASDTWIVENVSPDEAGAAGALYKEYTRIYLNASEYGSWLDRQWVADKLVVHKNNIYARLNTGAWKHINGDRKNIRIIIENGFAVWNMDTVNRNALIDDIPASWSLNYFNAANYWLKSGGIWYSQNGYSWDGVTLVESGLAMEIWRRKPVNGDPFPTGYYEMPLLISAGTRFENGEDVLYWIECNSGSVVRHIPSINQIQLVLKLYAGLGDRVTGLSYYKMLKPVIVDDDLYFIIDSQCYKYNFPSGLVSAFMGDISDIMAF